jgi:GTP cyclohydrolase II
MPGGQARPKEIARPSPKALDGIRLILVARAAADLRAGLPVFAFDKKQAALIIAAETLELHRLQESARIAHPIAPLLALTPMRAAALKIRVYSKQAVLLPLKPVELNPSVIHGLADPSKDLVFPIRGPFTPLRVTAPPVAAAALALVKHANLLPAAVLWILSVAKASTLRRKYDLLSVTLDEILDYEPTSTAALAIVAQADLPLSGAKKTRILAFRPPSGAREHLALLVANPSPEHPPLVRLHSECLTGDVFGSLKCDCGDQLRGAIARMGEDPHGGILLYLAQEGRGIGLINKLRAYDLQDQGFDTIEANLRLGFAADERNFGAAAVILKHLGFDKIRLLTNNPAKVLSLTEAGVTVAERVPHSFPANRHNAGYLNVKARKAGHLL